MPRSGPLATRPYSWQVNYWWYAVPCLLLPILAIYQNAGHFDYLGFDDPVYLTDNPHVNRGVSLDGLRWALTSYHGNYWGPITWLSFMLETQWFGVQASVSHWINVLLHSANTLLLYGFLVLATRAPGKSLCVALLFGIHPLHVESVAWVTERKDVLSVFWGLLTLFSYLYYSRRGGAGFYLLTFVLFTLAIATKPLMVTLPAIMIILDYWPIQKLSRSSGKKCLLEKAPFFCLSLAVSLVTSDSQQAALLAHSAQFISGLTQLAHVATDYLVYLWRMVYPVDLAAFYPRKPFPHIGWLTAAVLILPLLTFWTIRLRHSRPWLLAGWSWYVITLLPMSGIIVFGRNVPADRFVYLPSIGIFMMAVWSLDALFQQPKQRLALCVGGAVACALLVPTSHRQANVWKNDLTLFEHALRVTKDNYLAYNNLGTYYLDRRQVDQALVYLEEAHRLLPDYHETLNSLGLVYDLSGNASRAEGTFRRAILLYPAYDKPYVNLGSLLTRTGRYTEAIPLYTTALGFAPHNEKALNNLAALYLLTEQAKLAVPLLQQALSLSPDSASIHYNLGYAFYETGNFIEAAKALNRANHLHPDSPQIQSLIGLVDKQLSPSIPK